MFKSVFLWFSFFSLPCVFCTFPSHLQQQPPCKVCFPSLLCDTTLEWAKSINCYYVWTENMEHVQQMELKPSVITEMECTAYTHWALDAPVCVDTGHTAARGDRGHTHSFTTPSSTQDKSGKWWLRPRHEKNVWTFIKIKRTAWKEMFQRCYFALFASYTFRTLSLSRTALCTTEICRWSYINKYLLSTLIMFICPVLYSHHKHELCGKSWNPDSCSDEEHA